MITLLMQSFIADVMSNRVSPAVSRLVVKAVPSAPPAAVHEAVERLFRPASWQFSEHRGRGCASHSRARARSCMHDRDDVGGSRDTHPSQSVSETPRTEHDADLASARGAAIPDTAPRRCDRQGGSLLRARRSRSRARSRPLLARGVGGDGPAQREHRTHGDRPRTPCTARASSQGFRHPARSGLREPNTPRAHCGPTAGLWTAVRQARRMGRVWRCERRGLSHAAGGRVEVETPPRRFSIY